MKLRDLLVEGRALTAHVISVGMIKPHTGVNGHGWNMYDKLQKGLWFYLGGDIPLLATKGTFKKGDKVVLRGNDSRRKLGWVEITDMAPVTEKEVLEMLLRNQFDYYPAKAFKKKRFKRKLRTGFSVKGTEKMDKFEY